MSSTPAPNEADIPEPTPITANCEGCVRIKADVGINLMNGHLWLCRFCLDELNAKSPLLASATTRIKELEAEATMAKRAYETEKKSAAEQHARAEQAESALLSTRAEWRPIETAPNDGTLFLVSKAGVPGIGKMDKCTVRGGSDGNGGLKQWVEDCFRLFPSSLQWNPTHWMPFPAPPASAPATTQQQQQRGQLCGKTIVISQIHKMLGSCVLAEGHTGKCSDGLCDADLSG